MILQQQQSLEAQLWEAKGNGSQQGKVKQVGETNDTPASADTALQQMLPMPVFPCGQESEAHTQAEQIGISNQTE